MASNPKKAKPSDQQLVMDYLQNLEHPLKKEIEEVRLVILQSNPQLTEHIKWNAPSFCINNEDRITFQLQGKGFFRLVFHRGAKVKEDAGNGRLIDDTTGLLEWVTDDRAIIKFADMSDVEAKKEKLAQVITKWLEATSS